MLEQIVRRRSAAARIGRRARHEASTFSITVSSRNGRTT